MFPYRFASKAGRVLAWRMPTWSFQGRKAIRLFIIGLLMISLVLPASASASSKAPPKPSVDPEILKQLDAQSEVTVWVVMRKKADLTPARSIRNWEARGQFVYDQLQAAANRSQAGVRSLLSSRGKTYRSYWIVNAIQMTADKATLQELSTRQEIEKILPDRVYHISPSLAGTPQPAVNGIEWNIDRVRAPEVWSTFGTQGEGIVVANIDTGVQFDHPALVEQYRGNLGNGNFDHNYNWFDPSQICGAPSVAPCDNAGHGTHTMGTMVGSDGTAGENEIGVAPGARWIAVKGCEFFDCSTAALMASGEWILAPTDLNGANPRVDLRPHVVNNSWGGGPGDPFYQEIVNAWIASGIFPQFSNGNAGPFCDTSGSPGDYIESYSAGAFDVSDTIAEFSSRGGSLSAETKPNIAAPGVDVRSSVPGNGYELFSGTSMASPHVAGTVALLWAAAPALVGDIESTRALLDQTAVDVDDSSCGGTAADNNVWGEGRLDAFTAVELAPRGPTGMLEGTVTDASTGLPLSGAIVHAAGDFDRSTFTDAFGNYNFPALSVGTYEITVSLFAYLTQKATVNIAENASTVQDFALTPAPSHELSGTLHNQAGEPVSGAVVKILSTPIPPVITDENGLYQFAQVPEGEYDLQVTAQCYDPHIQHLVISQDQTLNLTLNQHVDAFGYTCEHGPFNFVEASMDIGLYGDENTLPVSLPFSFMLYGQTYDTAYISTNGALSFLGGHVGYPNLLIPDLTAPDAAIYPFWDDLIVDEGPASVRTELLGTAPNRQFVIEWRDVAFCCTTEERVRFEVTLFEDGRILMQYASIDANEREQGNSATIGIENETSTVAHQYSFDQPVLKEGLAIYYTPPPGGFVEGRVTDAADGAPLEGVQVKAVEADRISTTNADGQYRMFLAEGSYTLEASLAGYVTEQAAVTIVDQQTITQDFVLRSPRAQVTPDAFEFILPPGQTQSAALTISNVGQADLTFSIGEIGVSPLRKADMQPPSTDTRTAPEEYQPVPVASINGGGGGGGAVLVFMDVYPWGADSLLQVLDANSISYEIATSYEMGTRDLAPYKVVFLSSDQPPDFYGNYSANFNRFEDYVRNGGSLWVGAAAWGFNGGDFTGGPLPGGATVGSFTSEAFNEVLDPGHPTMQNVPNPFSGTGTSHTYFENLLPGTNVIARGQESGQPTLIEYEFESGRVLALAQTLEYGYFYGEDAGTILANSVPYIYAFEEFEDVLWLSEDITEGTVPPGGSQTIQVRVDTNALEPGVYQARLAVVTNDPRNSRVEIPVTLVVPAFILGVNAGGSAYTDLAGNVWAADQLYTPGSWGYVNRSTVISTQRAITGTDEDKLYQDQRVNILEYRFDGLAPGVYQVDLHFSELQNKAPNKRRFDIMMEGNMVMTFHDISLEVGTFAADRHTFFVAVTDGTLNVRFIPYRGYGVAVVNALWVLHRPDQ